MECLDNLGILTHTEQILGCLLEANDGDSQDGKHENKSTTGEQKVTPAPVVVLCAGVDVGAIPLGGDHETPREETGDGLAHTPPASHEGQEPLLVSREKFEEHGCIQNKVATAAEAEKSDEESEGGPVGHATSDDAATRAEEKGDVEGVFATDNIGTESPEDGSKQHTNVDRNGQAILVALLAKLSVCRGGHVGLEQSDHGIHSITKSIEEKELPMVWSPSNLINGLFIFFLKSAKQPQAQHHKATSQNELV